MLPRSFRLHPCRRPRGGCRRGNTLIFSILLIIAIMGLAALVLDLGIARLTQIQMQSAADAAATEALRFRDASADSILALRRANGEFAAALDEHCGPPPGDTYPQDPGSDWQSWAACAKNATPRLLAQHMIDLTFLDHGDPVSGVVTLHGAGPIYEFSGGIPLTHTDYIASQTISVDTNRYKPKVQLNFENNREIPDLQEGRYKRNAAYPSDEPRDEIGYEPYFEYERRDFVHPEDDTNDASPDAFIVRLRRTRDNALYDPDGGPLPYLFDPGSLLGPFAPGSLPGWNRDAQGISVRATSIAAAKPNDGEPVDPNQLRYPTGIAIAAGGAIIRRDLDPPVLIAGLAPFALNRSFWEDSGWQIDADPPDPTFETLDPQGTPKRQAILRVKVPSRPPGEILRSNVQGLSKVGDLSSLADLTVIGRAEQRSDNLSLLDASDADRPFFVYVPIVEDEDAGLGRVVVGFGYARWRYSAAPNESTHAELRIQRPSSMSNTLLPQVGDGHVTALMPHNTDVPTSAVFEVNRKLLCPLMAPVLVNRNLGPQP